jgi:hypothetical protein
MPTIDFDPTSQPGVDTTDYTFISTEWVQFDFGATVEAVQLRSRSGAIYVSLRRQSDAFSGSTDYLTVPDGREYELVLADQRSPMGPRVESMWISHSNATGEIELEIRKGGR